MERFIDMTTGHWIAGHVAAWSQTDDALHLQLLEQTSCERQSSARDTSAVFDLPECYGVFEVVRNALARLKISRGAK